MNGFIHYFSFLIFDKKCHFLWTRSKSLKVMIAWVSNLTSLLLFSNSFTGIAEPTFRNWIQVGNEKNSFNSNVFSDYTLVKSLSCSLDKLCTGFLVCTRPWLALNTESLDLEKQSEWFIVCFEKREGPQCIPPTS